MNKTLIKSIASILKIYIYYLNQLTDFLIIYYLVFISIYNINGQGKSKWSFNNRIYRRLIM